MAWVTMILTTVIFTAVALFILARIGFVRNYLGLGAPQPVVKTS